MDCWLKNFFGWFFCSEKPSGEILIYQYSLNYKYFQVIDKKYFTCYIDITTNYDKILHK